MPGPSPAEIQKAVRLQMAGRPEEAEGVYRRILADHPDEPNCLHMLGMLLYQRGDVAAAEPLMRKSLELVPVMSEWRNNFAVLCRSAGRFEEAIDHLRRAIHLNPDYVEAHDNLGLVLDDLKRPEEAAAAYAAAVTLDPQNPTPHDHWAQNLWRRRKVDGAIEHWRRVIQLQPRNADAQVNLGCALISRDRFEEAMSCFKEALRIDPRHVTAITNFAWLVFHGGQLDEAIALYAKAIEIDPRYAGAWMNLGMGLVDLGDCDEAITCYRRALAIEPDRADVRSNLLLALHYPANVTRREMFEEHRQYGQIHETPLAPQQLTHQNDRDPNRPLRVAYVSPDFCRHPVADFIEPALRAHDRSAFIISCYSDVKRADQDTERLRKQVSTWHETANLTDEELAEKIRVNREDILIDLTGHTARGRLLAFARKPAPVQISYLGYLNTTGLKTMDYRITDPIVDPPGESESYYTEQLLRLPCFFCYRPPEDAPPVALGKFGAITFGSLNHPAKFNPAVLDLWAKLLEAIPGARLALTINRSGESELRMRGLFVQRGIGPERLVLIRRQPYLNYLAAYHAIDIALDPFPFSGHTTTCEALWMGVPVVTMPGDSYASRMSTSVLKHLDMPELVARDADDYVRIAAELAGNIQRLGEIRASLRDRMRNSVITNAAEFTANLERAYREVWRKWTSA